MPARVRWHARWVVPVATPPVAEGTVITEGAHIVWVGERAFAPAGGHDEELGDAILTPGLVNTHTHLDLTMLRGALDGLGFFDWVRTVTAIGTEVLGDEDFAAAASLGVAEGLAGGVTTFADTAPREAAFEAMRAMGVRGIAFREVFGPDARHCASALATLRDQMASMRPRESPLVRVGVSPHAPYSVSDELFAAVGGFAAAERFPLAVHIAESEEEQQLVVSGTGRFAEFLRGRDIPVVPRGHEPLEIIERAGLLRAHTLLIHGVHVGDAALPRVAASGCGVAHCPASNARLGHGIAPVRALLKAGARVGLGSDSMASNDRMDLLEEARLASLQQRSKLRSPEALPAKTAFRLATLGGAEALRMDEDIGSLEVGKQADLAVFHVPPQGSPVTDPLHALVFGPRPRTDRVLVAGVERVRDGVVLGADPAWALRAADAAERVKRWRAQRSPG